MGTAFLGWIIEEISGKSLPDFLESRIFGPLSMSETSFYLAEEDRARFVDPYYHEDGALQGAQRSDAHEPVIRGDGDLLSTADDFARFMQMIIGGGQRAGVRLVGPESVAEMARNQLEGIVVVEQPGADPFLSRPFPLGAGRDGFGLGFQVTVGEDEGGRPPGSLSWAGIWNTHFWIDLENEIGVALLMQLLPFYDEKAIELLAKFERALYGQMQ